MSTFYLGTISSNPPISPETQNEEYFPKSPLWQSPIPREPAVSDLELPESQNSTDSRLESKICSINSKRDDDGDGNGKTF